MLITARSYRLKVSPIIVLPRKYGFGARFYKSKKGLPVFIDERIGLGIIFIFIYYKLLIIY